MHFNCIGGIMGMPNAPALAGIHHLKLPVTDLERSREWYLRRLGYQVQMEFVEQGRLMGVALSHPNGGPPLGVSMLTFGVVVRGVADPDGNRFCIVDLDHEHA